MPIRILENEKEGHRKVKTDFRKKRQQEYMKKHGPQQPRRKTLAVTDKYKEVRKKLKDPAGFKPLRASKQGGGRTRLLEELGRVEAEPSNRNRRAEISRVHGELNKGYAKGGRAAFKLGSKPRDKQTPNLKDKWKDWGKRIPRPRENLIEKMGGSEKAKPHSTKEGRVASGKRRIRRILEGAQRPKPKTSRPKPFPGGKWDENRLPRPGQPLRPKPSWPKREPMRPLRDKKGIGGILKKIVSKIKPKPKGKGLGSGIKPSEMHEIIPKKDRKLYLKEKLANPHKRVKKGHGGSTAQQHYMQHGYGPHKIQLRSGKPKIAKKGW